MSEPVQPDQVARQDFSLSFRGFDQNEVRAYLGRMAIEIAAWREREEQLRGRIAELEAVPIELDEVALEAALGREATSVIHAARHAAAEIRANAESEAAEKVAAADAALAKSSVEAEEATATIRAEVEEALAALRQDTERRATAILEESRAKAAAMVVDAASERDRVLDDLATRRRAIVDELEQLHAAREQLLRAYEGVRRALDAAVGAVVEAGDLADLVPAEPAPPAAAPEEAEPDTEAPVVWSDPEPASEVVPEPEVEAEIEPEPEPDVESEAEVRRSSSLKLVRRPVEPESTPVAPAVDEAFESVRIIRSEAEPEPEPVVAAEAEPESTSEDGAVEGLFAKLRADRAEKVANAEALLADHRTDEAPVPEPTAPPDGDEAAPSADLSVLAARDDAVANIERNLVRSLKRALADEQNEVLDALRRLRGMPSTAALLPDPAVHDARYDAVVGTGTADAAAAGGAAAGGDGGDAATLADQLGRSLATDIRTRVDRAVEESSGDVETLAEAISAVYREWKTAKAEPLARDAITAGFATGMYAAASGPLRWVVDPAEGGCPDCDDNALAGATPRGSTFPTGQLHPPAHAGCRCIVVAAD